VVPDNSLLDGELDRRELLDGDFAKELQGDVHAVRLHPANRVAALRVEQVDDFPIACFASSGTSQATKA
jgi:hypothetical protein